MKYFVYTLTFLFLVTLFSVPTVAMAEQHDQAGICSGLVPCGCDTGTWTPSESGSSWNHTSDTPNGTVEGPEQCSFNDFIGLIQNVLDWLVIVAIPLAGLMFAYAGWLYLSAQGDTNKIQSAHKVFTNVAIGLVLVIGAWVIVYTIASAVIREDVFNDFLS